MNNRTKSIIRSLGCRIIDDENVNCHGSNIQIIRMMQKDMGKHPMHSFCNSQTIELSENITGPEETKLVYDAMKHQLECKRQRDIKKIEMKIKGIPILDESEKEPEDKHSGMGEIAKAAGKKIGSGFKRYLSGGELTRKGKEELKESEEELKKLSSSKAELSKSLKEIDTSSAGFTVTTGG